MSSGTICQAAPDHAGPRASLFLDCIIFGLQGTGGIGTYWRHLARGMANSGEFEATMLMPRRAVVAKAEDADGPWRTRHEMLPAALTRFLPASCGNGILHTSYYRLPRSPVSRYVVTAYDFIYERHRRGPARTLHHWQKGLSLRRADTVICISNWTRREALEFFPELDPQRLRVVPLGVDTSMFHPPRNGSAGEQAKPPGVLFVGRRDAYKRFDLAVQALRGMPGLSLDIIGPPLAPAEASWLQRELPSRWIHHGTVNAARLRQLYQQAHALIYPSDCEGFGLPVLEAMACGCPVVASPEGALPEVGAEAACYATMQDSGCYAETLRRLEDSRFRQDKIEKGLARALEFSWERTVRMTMEAYRA